MSHFLEDKGQKIIKILPISDLYTPIISDYDNVHHTKRYSDAIADGWTVFHVLLENDEHEQESGLYIIDSECEYGEVADYGEVRLVPSIYCTKCKRRMFAETTSVEPNHVVYHCICGETLDSDEIDKARERT